MPDVFAGIRVLELATGLAAPYAGMFLADHGADVVKIEPPGGDPYRADPGFRTVNRGKRSVVTDDPAALVRGADVVLCDRPGRQAELRALNPAAVIVSMPPWGEHGPKVHDAATPDLVAAATGINWNQYSYAEVPVQLVFPIVGYATGVLGALAVAAGLLARERFAAAPTYEVSEVAGSLALQMAEFLDANGVLEKPGSCPMGSKGRVPCYRLFEAGDGRWFFLACGTVRFYERMLEVVGRPELKDDPRLPAPPWGTMLPDPLALLAPILEDAFATKPRDEWIALLRAADVPCQPVWTREEYLKSSIVAANGLDVAVEDPEVGEVRMMGVPLVLEAAPGRIRSRAPRLGEHDVTWAPRPDPGPVVAATATPAPAPLSGLSVIDLSSFIAGPLVSRHLAMLGASVVKVEAPGGDPFRAFGPPFAAWNCGKTSQVLDLQTAGGRAALHDLVRGADVVVENFRPGTAERLGVDDASLRAVRADLVTLSSTGYGDDASMAPVAAFDPLLQCLGGVMAAQGGDEEPVFLTVPVHDVMTPLLSAFGIVAALYHRARTGVAQRVRTSLAHATMAAQAAEYTRYAGRPEPRTGGFDFLGGAVEASDGWWFVDGNERVRVETRGVLASEVVVANELTTSHEHPEFGPLTLAGQLIRGAGPAPGRAPMLDEHRR